jgi:hypothetical protein
MRAHDRADGLTLRKLVAGGCGHPRRAARSHEGEQPNGEPGDTGAEVERIRIKQRDAAYMMAGDVCSSARQVGRGQSPNAARRSSFNCSVR